MSSFCTNKSFSNYCLCYDPVKAKFIYPTKNYFLFKPMFDESYGVLRETVKKITFLAENSIHFSPTTKLYISLADKGQPPLADMSAKNISFWMSPLSIHIYNPTKYLYTMTSSLKKNASKNHN